jgi:dipeptidyl aminopeptidase/acylaminoacyl peptidase
VFYFLEGTLIVTPQQLKKLTHFSILFYGVTGLLVWLIAGLSFVPGAAAQTDQPVHNLQFTINNSPLTSTIVFQTASGGLIYAVNPDGSNLRYLTTGLDPALSPDGQWVAFTRWETSQDGALGNVWLINIDGSGERVIHEYLYNPRTPTWSPDGTQLVISYQNGGRPDYERKCSGQRPPRDAVDIDINRESRDDVVFCYTLLPDPHWSLRRIDVTTGDSADLPGDLYSLSPAWSPTNSQHLIYDGEAGLVNLDLTENKTSALTTDMNDHSPVFSPDGTKIAVSYRQDDHWDIHTLNADGSGRTRLTETSYLTWVQQELSGQQPYSYNNAAPAWSPDGSQVAFLTDRTGRWEIWVMQADGSHQRPLFPPEVLAGIPLQYNGVDEQMLSWR